MNNTLIIFSSSFKKKCSYILLSMCFLLLMPLNSHAADAINQLYEKALIAFQNDKVSTTIIHLKNVLKINDRHMPSRILLAQSYLQQGDGIAAEVELNKAKIYNVDMNRLVTLFAHAYILQNKFEETIAITERKNRNDAIETELLIYRGQALIGQKLFRSADVAFADALILSPNNQLALLGRAQMALRALKPEKAMKYLDESLSQGKPFINGWIFKANLLQKYGKIEQAIVAIDKALQIDDSHMAARLTKATLHIIKKEFIEAEVHVDYIISKIPNEPRAGYLKALISASLHSESDQDGTKKLTGVISTLSAVPDEVMKNTPGYYYLAGLTNFQFGNLIDARRYLTQYLSYVENDIDTVRMIASIDLQQGDFSSAKNLLIKTNLSRPNDPNILTLLGMVYLQLQENKKAENYFNQVLAMYPGSEIGIGNLAQTKMQSGEYQSAIDALLSIKDNQINGQQIKLLLVESYQKNNNIEKALQVMLELVKQAPDNSYFQQKLGVLYGLNGKLPEARTAFERSLQLNRENILSIVHLARMDNIVNDSAKALAFLNAQLLLFPENSLIMAEISDTHFLTGDMDNALLWINKAYAATPDNFYILNKLSTLLTITGQLDQAITAVDLYIGQNIKERDALLLIASLYQKKNMHQQAILALRDYVKKSYDKTNAYILLAKAQLQAKENTGAMQSFRKAIVADQNSLSAHIGLVNLTIKNKDEQYSLSLINAIEQITQSQSLKEVLLGDLYFSLENTQKASEHYLSALSLSPQKKAVLGLYQSYKLENNVIKAIPYIKSWLKNKPNDLLVQITLADALSGSLQLQESANYYEKLLTKHGQLPILLNNAANVYFSLGNQDKALEYARKSYEYVSDSVAIMDTLAWIESRSGNHDKALGLFRQALTKDYDNAEVKYHIAVTLDALNRRAEAKKYLAEAVDSSQKFPERNEAELLLNSWL